jgi:O6-methylguanine-DNA--protein-cysteine methyltransferase
VNEFKRNHNQIYKNIGKTPKKLNSVPKVKNMNEALQNVWWNQYSKPTTPFENRLSGAIQKVQNSKKTKPSNVSNILNQGNFNSNETSQIKKLFPNQQVDSDRRLNVLSKLKGRKVGAILTYENAVRKEKQKRAARVQSNQTATADFEKRRVQNLLKNSGIKVTQSTSSTQKKVTVGK